MRFNFSFFVSQNLHRGVVTLKVRVKERGGPSPSTFTTPEATPTQPRRADSDTTSETSSTDLQGSPTMFKKLRNKRSKKTKTTDIVLYKGEKDTEKMLIESVVWTIWN